jgi:hypothetical protein
MRLDDEHVPASPDDLEDTHIGLPAIRDDSVAHSPVTRVAEVVELPLGYVVEPDDAGGVRRSRVVGLDPATPVLLFAWAAGTIAMLAVQLVQVPDDGSPLARELARSTIWATYITKVLTFAAIVAPLCWLAVVVAGKVLRFELPQGAYLRAAGVAALPEVALLCIQQFMPDNAALRALLVLGILPLAFLLLKLVFDLRVVEALVAYGLGLAFFAAGWFASNVLIGTVVASGLIRSQGAVELEAATGGPAPAPPPINPAPANPPPAKPWSAYTSPFEPGPVAGTTPPAAATPPAAPVPPAPNVAETVVAPLRGRVEALAGLAVAAEQEGPERATAQWREVAGDLAAAKAKYPGRPEWAGLDRAVAAAGGAIAALPPAVPPAVVFEPMPAGRAFDPLPGDAAGGGGGASALLGPEVSFANFRFRPPADARLDLDVATDNRSTLAYTLDRSPAKFTVSLVPRSNPRQRRPYAVARAYQRPAAAAQGLFVAADVADAGPGAAVDVSFGLLNGEPFARVLSRTPAGGDPSRDATTYACLVDADHWLVARVAEGPQKDPVAAIAFEAAARSLRKAGPDEPTEDPYAPAWVAAQFPADPARVGLLFRRRTAAAEPFVVGFLSHRDAAVRRAALDLLPAVASAASTRQLLPLAASPEAEVAAAVRPVLRRVAPAEFDAVAEALLDLRSADWGARERALDALAAAGAPPPPVPPIAVATGPATGPVVDAGGVRPAIGGRRTTVAAELETLVLDEQTPATAGDKAARLLADWGTPGTTARLARALAAPNLSSAVRDRLIGALSGSADRAAAAAILRWVVQAPEPVVAALSRMGPAAEDEVIRTVFATFSPGAAAAGGVGGANGPAVRQACVRVLREVGTAKSLDVLGRCLREARDFPAKAVVREAMDQVRSRAAAAKPGR